MPLPKSLALLSGGLDSCVALAIAREDSEVVAGVNVYYGQKHSREMQAAVDICKHYNIEYLALELGHFGELLTRLHATSLIDPDERLPADRRMSEMTARVPRSYVPGRNTIMLALAQSVAEALGVDEIYCGFNAVDYSGLADKEDARYKPVLIEVEALRC